MEGLGKQWTGKLEVERVDVWDPLSETLFVGQLGTGLCWVTKLAKGENQH